MAYDPHLRRTTPLAAKLRTAIEQKGPLTIEHYMQSCLFDAEHGYYKNATVIGRGGDFITAPEISQTFGELIGLWCAAVWQQMGAPDRVQLIELGAGRGTLLKDVLRAAKQVPAFYQAVSVAIVDTHPGLKDQQKKTLQSFQDRVAWHDDLLALNTQPTIFIANEFLDCLPIEQFIAMPGDPLIWQPRMVGVDDDSRLQFMHGRHGTPDAARPALRHAFAAEGLQDRKAGDIFETRRFAGTEIAKLKDFVRGEGARAVPCAGLFIDYGHTQSGAGDTLQAVRNHAYEHPLTSPGEADITAHVDFEQFAIAMTDAGFEVDGPATQGDFLGRLGIVERASHLIAHNPGQAGEIESAVARLLSPGGMGGQFHAIAIRTPDLAPLPGLSS